MAWPRSNSSSEIVGGDTSNSPRVHASSTASALYHTPAVSSPGQMSAVCSGGRAAMKKAVSKRSGAKAGVTREPAYSKSPGFDRESQLR